MMSDLSKVQRAALAAQRQVDAAQEALKAAQRNRDRAVARWSGARDRAPGRTVSDRELARQLGVTNGVIPEMVARGRRLPEPTVPTEPVAVLRAAEVRDYVEAGAFGEVAGALVAFSSADVLLECGAHPAVWADGTEVRPPTMVLRSTDGRLLGVENANCGYGGTGPTTAFRLLRDLGWPEEAAEAVFHHRFVDLDRAAVARAGDTIYGCGADLHVADNLLTAAVDSYTFGDTHLADRVRAWTEQVLDRPDRFPWAAGPRTARVYLSHQALPPGADSAASTSPLSVVIEQGSLHLWVAAYQPLDWADLFSQEQVGVLTAAGLYPGEQPDPRSALGKLFGRRAERPPFVDISGLGDRGLEHAPDTTLAVAGGGR